MRSPLEDTIWGSVYGSCAVVQETFDRIGPDYHSAIMASGVPARAAACLMPFLDPDARGVDLGCGSGAMGLSLSAAGLRHRLDGLDLSPGMLELARQTGCYGTLLRTNFLVPEECPPTTFPYDFAVTLGLVGDYIPYYVGLPALVARVKPDAFVGFGIEPKSTPERPLLKLAVEVGLTILSEDVLSIPLAGLERETYHFFVARRGPIPS